VSSWGNSLDKAKGEGDIAGSLESQKGFIREKEMGRKLIDV